MLQLTAAQRRTLELICDTLAPALTVEPGDDAALFGCSADQLHLTDQVEAAARRIDGDRAIVELARFLALLERPLMNGLMAGCWRRFSQLDLDRRIRVLHALSTSRITRLRRAFSTIKRLAMLHFYAGRTEAGANPTWKSLDYAPAVGEAECRSERKASLVPLEIDSAQTLEADVLVIGSGAGGGVVAAELAAAGYDVLIVEKGRFYRDDQFPADELTGLRELYERHGSLTTSDGATIVLAGSTVGGGTTVNWMTCLEPPPYVVEEWARDFGFAAAANGELASSLEFVAKRMGVTTGESPPNAQNGLLELGCRALGYETAVISRNVRGCRDCDYCGFGCRYGAKQDTRQTFLVDAAQRGARLLAQATCERLLHDGKSVRGAEVRAVARSGDSVRIEVKCRAAVVAAGAIHTPALLLRSGVVNPQLGRNLHLHPTTAVYARYAEAVHSWQGVPQSRVCEHFDDLDGSGYGVRMEAAPSHPGLWGMALPWDSPREHRRRMQQLPHLANIIVLTRDRHGGRVRIDEQGRPVLDYELHRDDARRLVRGTLEALRIQRAAGALEVFSPHHRDYTWRREGGESFEAWLGRVERQPIVKHGFGLFSAHQMSSCRIAARREQGAVRPDGQSWDLANLFVADASLMPTSCGVNPMLTIMGLAHHVAQHAKSKTR